METTSDANQRDSFIAPSKASKASIIYKTTGNLRAIQILLGHSKIENTVRYLGVEVDDALSLAEATEI